MKDFVRRNACDGWRLDDLDGRTAAKCPHTATYRDYPDLVRLDLAGRRRQPLRRLGI